MEEELKRRCSGWAPITPEKSKRTGNYSYAEKVDLDASSKPQKKRKRMKRHNSKIYDKTKEWNVPKPSTPKQNTPGKRKKTGQSEIWKNEKKAKISIDHQSCKRRIDFDDTDIIENHISELVKLLLPTEKQRKTAVNYPLVYNCVLNLSSLVNIRKSRSRRNDLLNLLSIVRRKRSKIPIGTNKPIQNAVKNDLVGECVGDSLVSSGEKDRVVQEQTTIQDQADGNKDVMALNLIMESKFDNYNYLDGVQDETCGKENVMALDLNMEPKFDDNIYLNGKDNMENHFPDLISNNVCSRQRIMKTCPAKCTLKLIPRNVPPNLDRDYILSNRDNVAWVEDLINFIIRKFTCLRVGENSSVVVQDVKINDALVPLNKKLVRLKKKVKNELVLANSIEKRRKQWPRVHLDLETRNWNQMKNDKGKEKIEEDENCDKAKYWKKERHEIYVLAKSFIECMNPLLGDRSYSEWKGSVVASIVGVYLTQNVSDFLSSNCYMYLKAKYGIDTKSSKKSTENLMVGGSQQSISSEHSVNSTAYKVDESIENILVDNYQESTEDTEQLTNLENNQFNILMSEEVTFETNSKVALETDFVGSQVVDHVTVEDETIVESQESVTLEKCPSSQESVTLGKNRSVKPGIIKQSDWSEWSRIYKTDKTIDPIDSINWEAIHHAPVSEIAEVIESRGQNNIIAGRIKDFLNRVIDERGCIDLEFLKYATLQETQNYLLSIDGLGLKSVECVRLLCLHQLAFPVDTNVGRILVRLGWIPLKYPLPENVPFHLLNQYPSLDDIQKYVWPRLKNLPVSMLYQLHYLLITVGKTFCTKKTPNCNACPMKGGCSYFASANPRSTHRLPAFQGEKKKESPNIDTEASQIKLTPQLVHDVIISEVGHEAKNCEPIIEIPSSPQPHTEMPSSLEPIIEMPSSPEMRPPDNDIEDFGCEFEDEIPHNSENKNQSVHSYMVSCGSSPEKNDMSKALQFQGEIDISALFFSCNPMTTQKHKDQKRYKLPDSHRLLERFERRDSADSYPYILLIWKIDDAKASSLTCDSPEYSVPNQEEVSYTGTILIPCRTANKGEFPLNGTYFQVNEVFADHETSECPISVSENDFANLEKSFLFCGVSVTSISRGMTTRGIQYLFRKGFICIRGFDRFKGRPEALPKRLHSFTSTKKK